MTYKEAVKMQWRRDAADRICGDFGWKNEECQNTQAIVTLQNNNIELSEGIRAAMFPLSSYAGAFLFGVLSWKLMFNYMRYGSDQGKTVMIWFLYYIGPLPFLP